MKQKSASGLTLPVLGLGTWEIGGRFAPDLSKEAAWIAHIKDCYDQGLVHFDTAEMYGAGYTEELLARALHTKPRASYMITSKVWKTNLTYEATLKAAEGSLKRLKTDYLDLYLVHKPTDPMDLKGTMKAFEELMEQGKVKAIGVSNFSIAHVKEAQSYLQKAKLTAVQHEYNVVNQNKELHRYCVDHDLMFIAYRPLLKGELLHVHHTTIDALAQTYDKTKAQIMLNWLLSKKNVVTIPKFSSHAHLMDNLGALGWEMSADDYKKLDA